MFSQFKPFSMSIALIAILGTFLIIDAGIVSQADAQVVLTEVDYHNDFIEITNMGASTVNISDWQLCSLFNYRKISALTVVKGSMNLEPGGVIVLSGFALNDVAGDLGLYSSGNFASALAMESFVQWGSSGNGREAVAVIKGIWKLGDFVSTVAKGHSIEYEGVGISAGAWFDQANPNFGTFAGNAKATFGVALEVEGDASLSTSIPIVGVTYTLKVTNTGNRKDMIRLSAFPEVGIEGTVLGALSQTSVQLEAGASARVTLIVTGDAFIKAGKYEVTVMATSASDQTVVAQVTTTTTIEIALKLGVALGVKGNIAQTTNAPEKGVTYTLTVTNTGNQKDTIQLAARTGVSAQGVVQATLSQTSVQLDAGASAEMTLTVTGKATTPPGKYEVT
ncbi:hypothetical protein HYR99_38375, partial [Candidatus Poribacteria bacterium]|nr:hypothetical protein [Candidatus Poribacteria bacterium]